MAALVEKDTSPLIKQCVDYLTLKGKRDDLRLPLSSTDAGRLEALTRYFGARGVADELPEFVRRDHRRVDARLAVQFQRADGTLGDGTAENLSGDGAFVATRTPLPAGTRTILRASLRAGDGGSGCEYRIVGEVAWSLREGGMGIRFIGIPLELRKNVPAASKHRSALHAA